MTVGLNNPLNVRRTAVAWQGELPGSGAFADFDTEQNGMRAGFICILRAWKDHACNTVYSVVAHFAPPSENPTSTYARFVASRLGVNPGVPGDAKPGDCINLADPVELDRTADAMAWWESHTVVAGAVLKAARDAALAHLGL